MPEAAPLLRRSVRHKLLAIALIPVLVILPLFLGVTLYQWSHKLDRLLLVKVNSDLTVARQYLGRILDTTGERIEMLARSEEFARTTDPGALLETYRDRLGLDYLYLAAPDGRIVASSPEDAHPVPPRNPAPAQGAWNTLEVFDRDQLYAIAPALAVRAEMERPGSAAASRSSIETRGIVAQSIVAAKLPGEDAAASMVGGILLNRNLSVVDSINALIYRSDSLPEGSHGTTSLFLDDLRIATNVTVPGGARALGTRASTAVRDRVIGQGQVWLDRAQVLDDWYVSAYAPLRDGAGRPVGMIYVGILEHPFAAAKRRTVGWVLIGFLSVALVTVPLFLRWARSIFRPLERIGATFEKVGAGDLAARTGISRGDDEIAELALALDGVLAQLQDHDRQMRAWNDELNQKVEDRTAALRRAAQELEAATYQLVQSEKLAALGEISAGIAHEINNPLAVIQGNLDVLREVLGDAATPADTELRLIDDQIRRISLIVTQLLDFARADQAGEDHPATDLAQAVAECVPLVGHMLARSSVSLRQDIRSDRPVRISRIAVQQVLVNLIVNAVHAMPKGGEIRIAGQDEDRAGAAGVLLEVADDGEGIPAAILKNLFEPFVTSRAGSGGTGLGLSICRRLIERQGGTIAVSSDNGGSTFRIWLPAA
ncbi:sensor histidine kinase [Paracoccus denitrificans]|jgi:signal transduction histidine kinase|uniref:histidine kinase n=1 Tax=Paracoccus denitrificans (strain Pd 1222) TaxID=318586 RepID=A1B979_PARDP|nr:cache domain-containing protein [Paracoccus denitrificans]ABL72073.1 integral membrane sensor signal transduction histidine kinase [Paracoccus denitrificans PD1222]MBB4626018.1 signal transduction histidine kinase [Paracoccus denitrificans]MCU7426822.1 cache domain-containing protein [Paracoccus denitrificans]QAR28651.1 HAMP domain-containing protein [Paracoccus denitrificans]UPV96797.1 cache domain-containing protein [Paracoccus denitrificans]